MPRIEVKKHIANSTLQSGQVVLVNGTGEFGRALAAACAANGIEVAAFVQSAPTAKLCDAKHVFNWTQIPINYRNLPILIGVHNRSVPSQYLVELARGAGFSQILTPTMYYQQFRNELGWRYWLEDPDFYNSYADELNWIYQRVEDDTSRDCLQNLVNFRTGNNEQYSLFTHEEKQYFNKITLNNSKTRPIHYIDAGAFNGDSYFELVKLVSVQEAYLFEPDKRNFSALVQNMATLSHRAHCIPLGLSDRYEYLSFVEGAGEGARIDAAGTSGISTVSVDQFFQNIPLTFLKVDVEGAERQVLNGAAQTIATNKPIISISCYHQANDIFELPQIIDRIYPDYSFYFRQHYYNSFDLVLYATPNNV